MQLELTQWKRQPQQAGVPTLVPQLAYEGDVILPRGVRATNRRRELTHLINKEY